MDNYTADTRAWLDKRFKLTDAESVYFAHQPIYGFRAGHNEPGMINRYIITYRIIRALNGLKFNTLLDVGGAEGYKAALIRSLFGSKVMSVDLSSEACKRAKEIYDIDGASVDICQLPYRDNQFDIVLCSETLEHVNDLQAAARELLRVSAKAVVVTVPCESAKTIAKNIKDNVNHAHIHSLNVDSFNFIKDECKNVIVFKYHNKLVKFLAYIADAVRISGFYGYPKLLVHIYNFVLPLIRVVFVKKFIYYMVAADDALVKFNNHHSGVLFIIIKDESCLSSAQSNNISVSQIVDFTVPYHYLHVAE